MIYKYDKYMIHISYTIHDEYMIHIFVVYKYDTLYDVYTIPYLVLLR